MKKFLLSFYSYILLFIIGAISCYFLCFFCFNSSKVAPSSPELAVGIVNLSVIRNEALVFRNFKDSVNKLYKSFHAEILEKETELRKNYDEIKKLEKAHTPPGDLQKRRSVLDKQVSELEKNIRDKKDQLNIKLATMTQEIEQTIHSIVLEVSQEHHLNLVFNATILDAPVVLFGGKEFDITEEVVKKLDKKLPSVHLQ